MSETIEWNDLLGLKKMHEIKKEILKIVVFYSDRDSESSWRVICSEVNIFAEKLQSDNSEDAKKEALEIVENKICELRSILDEFKAVT